MIRTLLVVLLVAAPLCAAPQAPLPVPRPVAAGTRGHQLGPADMISEAVAEGTRGFWTNRPWVWEIPVFESFNLTFAKDSLSAYLTLDTGRRVLRRWDPATRKEVRSVPVGLFSPPAGPSVETRVAVAANGTVAAWADWDGKVRVLDWTTGKPLHEIAAHPGRVTALAISGDGKRLAVAGHRDAIRVWDVATAKEVSAFPSGQVGIKWLQFAADGKTLAWGSEIHGARLLNADKGTEDVHLKPNVGVEAFALSPDGRRLAVGQSHRQLSLFDTSTGKRLLHLDRADRWDVDSRPVTFSPDGRTLAVSGQGATVYLLESATGNFRTSFGRDVCLPADAFAFAPDGRRLAVSAGNLFVYDLATEVWSRNIGDALPASLTADQAGSFWDDLSNTRQSRMAYAAMWALAAHPDHALPRLRKALRPVPLLEVGRIDQWIRDLDHARFTVREAAVRDLEAVAEAAGPALRKVLANKPSAEVAYRAGQLMAKLEARGTSPEWIVTQRHLELLERIGNPAARELIAELAKGEPTARLTVDAKASLRRMEGGTP